MRDCIAHRWFVIGLLLAKLVLGSLAPMGLAHAGSDVQDHSTHETAPCMHQQGEQAVALPGEGCESAAAAGESSDCCKEGSCYCPCAHTAALLAPFAAPPGAYGATVGAAFHVLPPAAQQPSVFFRPPIERR